MTKFLSTAVVVTVALLASACVSTVEQKENMLIAAGFQVKVADTPDKIAALTALPPHKFQMKNQGGQVVYLYADPTICKCLYFGTASAFQAYQQMAFDQRLADQKLMTATMMQDTQWNYWGAWGPWY
ncbi:hypothetical protein [Microvirga antarctica]|uniref:hypothetical protein n=1 Tax=Microvirga antarctica TaxID=2819233 RepID=UPI001FEB6D21|nr:hypothetical protein [Microvirga antarctica]